MYQAPYRNDSKASLKVSHRENLWIDYGEGAGGTLIDLVLKIHPDKTISEAIREIDQSTSFFFSFHQQKTLSRKQSNSEESRFGSWRAPDPKHDSMDDCRSPKNLLADRGKIISKNGAGKIQYLKDKKGSISIYKLQELGNNPIITSYLNQRGIQTPTAMPYFKEIYYKVNEKRYFGLAHRNNNGWSIRNKYWKGCTAQGYSYYQNHQDTLLIFEGIFDMLSFLELRKLDKDSADMLILNSLLNLKIATRIIGNYPLIKLYLDHDEAGRKVTQNILLQFPKAKDESGFYSFYKDLNEYQLKKFDQKMVNKEEYLKKENQ